MVELVDFREKSTRSENCRDQRDSGEKLQKNVNFENGRVGRFLREKSQKNESLNEREGWNALFCRAN